MHLKGITGDSIPYITIILKIDNQRGFYAILSKKHSMNSEIILKINILRLKISESVIF
jgi:hypothetical protein